MFPPLTQMLGAGSHRPRCCPIRINVFSALGTLQIMVGLFNVGLGPGRTSTHPGDLTSLGAAYWLGAVYIISGIVSLFVCPSTRWVVFMAFVNVLAAICAIIGIALYALDLEGSSFASMCNGSGSDNCVRVAYFAQNLLTGMDITLIVMGALQLCSCITLAVYCIKILCGPISKEEMLEKESHESMVKQVMTSPGA